MVDMDLRLVGSYISRRNISAGLKGKGGGEAFNTGRHGIFSILGDLDTLGGFFKLEILNQLDPVHVGFIVLEGALSLPCKPVRE